MKQRLRDRIKYYERLKELDPNNEPNNEQKIINLAYEMIIMELNNLLNNY